MRKKLAASDQKPRLKAPPPKPVVITQPHPAAWKHAREIQKHYGASVVHLLLGVDGSVYVMNTNPGKAPAWELDIISQRLRAQYQVEVNAH